MTSVFREECSSANSTYTVAETSVFQHSALVANGPFAANTRSFAQIQSRDEEKASRNRDQFGANTSLSSVSSLSALAPPFVVSFSSNGSSSFSDLSKGARSSLPEIVLSSVEHRAGQVSQPTEFSSAGTHTMGRF